MRIHGILRKKIGQLITRKNKEEGEFNHDILCDSVLNSIDLTKNCSKIALRVITRAREVCVEGRWG